MTDLEPATAACHTSSIYTERTEDNFAALLTFRDSHATGLINCAPASDCYRVTPAQGPEGISFLVTESTIERVDIVAGPLTTRSGIGIGSPEDDIINLFGDQIETQVNDDSSVDLIFVPQDESDAEFRVIFTIRDGVVETFRSGRIPQVTVQNPCAG